MLTRDNLSLCGASCICLLKCLQLRSGVLLRASAMRASAMLSSLTMLLRPTS